MSLQSGPVITSQGVLINSRMKQATVDRAIGDHKRHFNIPQRLHYMVPSVRVVDTWNSRKCNEGMWSSANLLSMCFCLRCAQRGTQNKTQNNRAVSAKCCLPLKHSGTEEDRYTHHLVNIILWSFNIPQRCRPRPQTLWERSPHLASASILLSLCKEIQTSASIRKLPTYLLTKRGD